MFSIKQFLINSSAEVRQEIIKLIQEIEASISSEEVPDVPSEVKTPTEN